MKIFLQSGNQQQVDLLADFSWLQLNSVFSEVRKNRRRPKVFLFLSPESRGSLRNRSLSEKSFVHFQQKRGGGATLKQPPCAWVSRLDQVPEETAHLFALVHKPESKTEIRSIHEELWSMTLHECFGKLGHEFTFGSADKKLSRPKKQIQDPEDIWHFAHEEGYFLGSKLAQLFFSEKISARQLQDFFKKDWNTKGAGKSLKFLYQLLNLKPASPDFKVE